MCKVYVGNHVRYKNTDNMPIKPHMQIETYIPLITMCHQVALPRQALDFLESQPIKPLVPGQRQTYQPVQPPIKAGLGLIVLSTKNHIVRDLNPNTL